MKLALEKNDIQTLAMEVAELIKPLLSAKDNEDKPFFDVPALALFLCVEESWIYSQVHMKKIPFFKFGKYVRFKKSEIKEWSKTLKSR